MTLYIGVEIHARQQTVSYVDTKMGVPSNGNCTISAMKSELSTVSSVVK